MTEDCTGAEVRFGPTGQSGVGAQPGKPGQGPDGPGRPLFGARAEARRRVVARIEEAEVVDAEADLPRQLVPRTRLARRRPSDGDLRVPRGEPLDHPGAAHRLLTVRREVKRVAPLGQLDDG